MHCEPFASYFICFFSSFFFIGFCGPLYKQTHPPQTHHKPRAPQPSPLSARKHTRKCEKKKSQQPNTSLRLSISLCFIYLSCWFLKRRRKKKKEDLEMRIRRNAKIWRCRLGRTPRSPLSCSRRTLQLRRTSRHTCARSLSYFIF
ncbi:unnamed protein product [Prunus brigantina]